MLLETLQEERSNKEKKDQNQNHHPPQKQQQQGPVSNHNQKQEQHMWDVWHAEPRDVVYLQQHTTTKGAVANREEERVHLLALISFTAPVFQFDKSWLNADAW